MAEHQGPNRHAAIRILVGGQDVTSVLHPYLISCQVTNTLEGGTSQCHIELDDRNAELQLPPDGVDMQVALGWANEGPRIPNRGRTSEFEGGIPEILSSVTEQFAREMGSKELPWGGPGMDLVFSGWVESVESGFGRRGGGRRVWIDGTSSNVAGGAKEGSQQTWGQGEKTDGGGSGGSGGAGGGGGGAGGGGGGAGGGEIPLSQVLKDAFGAAGISVKIPDEMGNISRKFWEMRGRSPQDFAQSMARELGAYFSINGNVATFIKQNSGRNADGILMDVIEAEWGVNLIGWRIKPYLNRAQWGSARANNFNIFGGVWENAKQMIGGTTPFGGATAQFLNPTPMANQKQGEQSNSGSDRDSQSRRGTGWVLFNGDPRAKAGGFVFILKARPGVDGKYLMKEIEHNYTRGVGFTTRANVSFPEPFRDGYAWSRPGSSAGLGPSPQAVTPPATPPAPPTYFTEEELRRVRQWFVDNGRELPPALWQFTDPEGPGYVPRPPRELGPRPPREFPDAQTWTPEQLELIRRILQGTQPDIVPPTPPEPPSSSIGAP